MVPQVEDAVQRGRPYDYILVCVKVIPELYELADVIADVVTPSHTCILLNTTTTIGVERSLFIGHGELTVTGALVKDFNRYFAADAINANVGVGYRIIR